MKVTEVPAHIVVADAPMLTDAVSNGFTVTGMELEVAGEPVMQVALLVMTQATASLLANVVVVKVLLVCPATGEPFTLHW